MARLHDQTLTFLTLRLHVRRQPSLGRRQCETKEINEQNKTVQNHHSTASIAADPVRAFANHPIVEIACTRPICLSSHAVGTQVFVHHSDSRVALV